MGLNFVVTLSCNPTLCDTHTHTNTYIHTPGLDRSPPPNSRTLCLSRSLSGSLLRVQPECRFHLKKQNCIKWYLCRARSQVVFCMRPSLADFCVDLKPNTSLPREVGCEGLLCGCFLTLHFIPPCYYICKAEDRKKQKDGWISPWQKLPILLRFGVCVCVYVLTSLPVPLPLIRC